MHIHKRDKQKYFRLQIIQALIKKQVDTLRCVHITKKYFLSNKQNQRDPWMSVSSTI